jgi:FkbM family methyltransferase
MKKINAFFFRDFDNCYLPEILKEMYRDRVYDPYLKGKKDLVMADFGANIGMFSYYAHDMAKVIYAVEPSKEHFEVLTKMIEFNGLERVKPIKKALSNKNGKTTFYHNDNTTMFSLKAEVNSRPSESEEVETIDFEQFFIENDIKHLDFVKIDIEGSEAEVFGSEAFSKVADKIDIIMGEFHSWTNLNPSQFANYLRDNNFNFKWANATEASLFIAERIK